MASHIKVGFQGLLPKLCFFKKFPVTFNSSDPEGMLKDNSMRLADVNWVPDFWEILLNLDGK